MTAQNASLRILTQKFEQLQALQDEYLDMGATYRAELVECELQELAEQIYALEEA